MRKLLMGAVVALSVALLAPATAFADDPVFPGDPYESVNEVRDVATGQPCGALVFDGTEVSGGCDVGPVQFRWILGDPENEYENGYLVCHAYGDALGIAADGEMALEVAGFGECNHSHPWGIHPCRDGAGDEIPWVGSLYVDPAQPGKLFGYLPACIDVGGSWTFDYFSVEVEVDANDHFVGWTHAASVSGELLTDDWYFSDSVEIDF